MNATNFGDMRERLDKDLLEIVYFSFILISLHCSPVLDCPNFRLVDCPSVLYISYILSPVKSYKMVKNRKQKLEILIFNIID